MVNDSYSTSPAGNSSKTYLYSQVSNSVFKVSSDTAAQLHSHEVNSTNLKVNELFRSHSSSIDLSETVCDDSTMKEIVKNVKEKTSISEIRLSRKNLSSSQITMLQDLASTRRQLVLDVVEGGYLGGPETNWPKYYEELYEEPLGLRESPKQAIDLFEKEFGRLPNSFIDFGAGPGSNTIPLMMRGCTNIVAIDFCAKQKKDFLAKVEKLGLKSLLGSVSYHVCEFSEYELKSPVELHISNYTWPYRIQELFKECWDKSVESVAENGYLCGEFFDDPKSDDDLKTYSFHSYEEIICLLKESSLDLKWYKRVSCEELMKRKDFDALPCCTVHRIVAQKMTCFSF